MSMEKQQALVCALADKLFGAGSWCGETHMQKAVYIAKRWLGISEFEDYEFILYMYGPFSFDLKRELRVMRMEGWLQPCFPPGMPYGPTLRPTEQAEWTSDAHAREFDFIAEEFSGKNVAELERLDHRLAGDREVGQGHLRERARLSIADMETPFCRNGGVAGGPGRGQYAETHRQPEADETGGITVRKNGGQSPEGTSAAGLAGKAAIV